MCRSISSLSWLSLQDSGQFHGQVDLIPVKGPRFWLHIAENVLINDRFRFPTKSISLWEHKFVIPFFRSAGSVLFKITAKIEIKLQ
jgi:hypothetical protein